MSSQQEFKQRDRLPARPAIAHAPTQVLFANAHPSMSHVSADFIPVFGECIRMTREVLFSKDAQPFLIAGSGTLGWDQVSANLVEPGENVLVLHSGYFGDSFAECRPVKAPIGAAVTQEEIEKALKAKKYKVLTFTHVDTSTGVLSDAKAIGETVKRVSPDTLVVLDGVCAVASEEIRMDDWGIDVVLTASQKGLGTPPGLSILVASQKAIKVTDARCTRLTTIADPASPRPRWLPVMNAYEKGSPAYFATPPVNLIYAFHASLSTITRGSVSLEERFAAHRKASARMKEAVTAMGLKQLPLDPAFAANGMTAVYYPEGFGAANTLAPLAQKGIVAAGGLHKDIKDTYFRIGHMGITVVDPSRGDMDHVIDSLKAVFGKQ
ncbi:pyridoxal phosphate-dependent transferase [Schizophyllum amplum]|uniref:alanine--glyoxylate transaminase n=1 Tax=Schizophyllum amplum TaxID=97359 RepID=A0A550CK85_9AGAR|nr:pyridoxal phosphate-dependent transferase [Auriculariopsis ampla]